MNAPRILARDGGWIVVEKPSGVYSHPTGDGGPDLVTWLESEASIPPGTRPAHRLDVGTSGIVLCGAGPGDRARAGAIFESGGFSKRYLALVIGRAQAKGTIRRRLKERGGAVDAVTRYRCVERLGGFSLLEVRPETGRRHQIRRHLHGIGLPLVGDDRYRPRRFRAVPGFPGRLWLHAWRLDPPEGEGWTCPLPPALEAHLALLREGAERGRGERPLEGGA